MRFRDLNTGKFISERAVRDAVDAVADLASRRMGESAARFRAGQISITEWQAESMQVIKQANVAATLLASGGRQNVTPQQWGAAGQMIRTEYAYFRRFVSDVLDGQQRQNGRLDARARMYGNIARRNYESLRRRQGYDNGFQYERNVRHSSEACRGCVAASAAGWVPIGTLPPIGQRECRGSCRCTLALSRTRPQEEAA